MSTEKNTIKDIIKFICELPPENDAKKIANALNVKFPKSCMDEEDLIKGLIEKLQIYDIQKEPLVLLERLIGEAISNDGQAFPKLNKLQILGIIRKMLSMKITPAKIASAIHSIDPSLGISEAEVITEIAGELGDLNHGVPDPEYDK